MTTYILHLKHDHGTIRIMTAAGSKESAIAIVMNAEGCPRSAITKIVTK